MPKSGSSYLNRILSYFNKSVSLVSFGILLMFLGHTNPKKLWLSVNAVVLDLYKITEPREQQLKVEILHDLKEVRKGFF